MATTGRYLYGLIRAKDDVEFGSIGLEHDGSRGRVHTVLVDSMGAVVSDFSPRERLLPLRKNLEPHNEVLKEVMKSTTVVPMTFGHVARSDEEIRKTLRRHRAAIGSQLDRVGGTVEMGLKVKWDVDSIYDYIVSVDPELAAMRDQIFGRSAAPSANEKMELGKLFEDRLNREREDQTERVLDLFKADVREAKVNVPKGEKMVMDLAFLVERGAQKAFEERVYQVAGAFPAEYIFDYSGPWAPFHFVDLDLGLDAEN
jgi:hypothetical protein